MQIIHTDDHGWTRFCDCDLGIIWNNADPASGQFHYCEDCDGTGLIDVSDEQAEELLAESAPITPDMIAKAEANIAPYIARINAAFGVRS